MRTQNQSIKCDAIDSNTAKYLLGLAKSGPTQQRKQHINSSNNSKSILRTPENNRSNPFAVKSKNSIELTDSSSSSSDNTPQQRTEPTISSNKSNPIFDKYKKTNSRKTGLKRKRKTITDYMEDILQNGSLSDVEIIVNGFKFNAHKVILMARSPVFSVMFEHQMKESQQNRVDINGIDKEVFAKVLLFIYCDKVCNEDIESNIGLFIAADKVYIHMI